MKIIRHKQSLSFQDQKIFAKIAIQRLNGKQIWLQQQDNKMQDNEISIAMPEIASQKYKLHMKDIEQSIKNLNGFTDNLEQKVGLMLKGQETQFVNSYKLHMGKIELALKQYQQKIQDYQKRVDYYQNEGVLATLIIKINFMEAHQKKLLSDIDKKDHTITTLKTEIKIQNGQIKSLQQKIKELYRVRFASDQNKLQEEEVKVSPHTFATEIPTMDKYTMRSNPSLDKSNQQFLTLSNPQNSKEEQNLALKRANQELQSLKKRNRHLSSVNSKIIQKSSSLEQFFLKIVTDLKRKICVRKNFTSCTFEQFKQEDKLELLVKILSNDDILQHLYTKIFSKLSIFDLKRKVIKQDNKQSLEIQQIYKSEKLRVQNNNKLPSIGNKRVF